MIGTLTKVGELHNEEAEVVTPPPLKQLANALLGNEEQNRKKSRKGRKKKRGADPPNPALPFKGYAKIIL